MADSSTKPTLDNYLFFVAIVEAGSLTKAAHRLAIPKSKLSRRLAQLEQQLGSELLIRTTRKLHLTEAGHTLYQSCQPHVDALTNVEQLVHDSQHKVKGVLNLSIPSEFFSQVIGQLLTDFAVKYPEIELHCHQYTARMPSYDHRYDLVFVLHEKPLPATNWVGRTLLSFPQSIYQSAGAKKMDCSMADLEHLGAIVTDEDELWAFRHDGAIQEIKPQLNMAMASPEMRLQACQRGIGITKLPDYIAEKASGIKPLHLQQSVVAQQLTLLYQSRNVPIKTRAFLDFFQSNIGSLS